MRLLHRCSRARADKWRQSLARPTCPSLPTTKGALMCAFGYMITDERCAATSQTAGVRAAIRLSPRTSSEASPQVATPVARALALASACLLAFPRSLSALRLVRELGGATKMTLTTARRWFYRVPEQPRRSLWPQADRWPRKSRRHRAALSHARLARSDGQVCVRRRRAAFHHGRL